MRRWDIRDIRDIREIGDIGDIGDRRIRAGWRVSNGNSWGRWDSALW